ncbi:MAG: ABC transporter ATP-binding protein [Acidobacteriota bacterium]
MTFVVDDPIIKLEQLVFSYGDTRAVDGISLDVGSGEILGYIGPNGAGKTTTVRILVGMLQGFEGEAFVGGHDLRTEPLEVKRLIGYVPESAALYESLTPQEFFTFVARVRGMNDDVSQLRSRRLLELLGMKEGYDQRISGFSKGMRQKVLLVAAMLHNPKVLFLDEPLSGLDANSVVTFKEVIQQLADRGRSIFYCSHVMDVVERVCHRIVIISKGRIVADGTFEELQQMAEAGSLEHIFTRLTSDESEEQVASRFVEVLFEDGFDA